MRIVLFTGKGGVGKTTAAAATALRLADRGAKTLLLSTDTAHSLGDALDVGLGDDPTEITANLWAVQIDTQGRLEAAWRDVQSYLVELLTRGGVDPITADELTMLPGVDEVLALLAVRELAVSGTWDAVVIDCAPTAETLRLLALPEALGWYLQRVFPAQRKIFGELALLQEHHTRTATVVALERAETVTLSRAVFAEARRSHPELVDVVTRLLAETVERLSQALLEAMYLGVDERVARRLVELAEIYRSGAERIVVPITQDELAGMAGTTRPTANLVLGRLAEAGAVRLERGRIEVIDLAVLRRHGGLPD